MSLLEPIEDFHLQLIRVFGRNLFSDLFYWTGWAKCKKSLSLNSDLAILAIANAMTAGVNFNY